MKMKKPLDPLCPSIQAALDLLGRPWTGLVLAVLQEGALRYSELSTRVAGIGDKTLSARLKELEGKGLIIRQVDPGPPIRVAYRLTPKGAGFRKVVEAIDLWGRQFVESESAPEAETRKPRRAAGRSVSRKAG
jgi:DNA-binding HxlR family transcriptional regulator